MLVGRRATSFFQGRPRAASGSRGYRAYAGRPGRDLSPSPAAWRRAPGARRQSIRVPVRSSDRSSTSTAPSFAPICRSSASRFGTMRAIDDVAIPRNRIRHELLPLLRRDFSPGIVEILAREAAIARSDEDRLQREAIDLAGLIVLRNNTASSGATEAVEVDAVALCSAHPALAGRVARLAMEMVAPGRFVGFDHIERLLEFASDRGVRGPLSLPGQCATRHGSKILLRRPELPQPFANSFRVSLSIPGEVVLAGHGWAVSATPGDTQPGHSTGTLNVECPRLEQQVAADGLRLPLAVRSRRPGDRFSPLGMGGRKKKLQDVLVDRKVAREMRDSLPLVVDSADNIVWVVGQSVAEDFRVTRASQAVIFLKARRLGGQG